ncbi:MAG: hypothetical protein AAFR79_14390 [Pseudomonadota bacterium]
MAGIMKANIGRQPFYGTDQNDFLQGNNGVNQIFGRGGNDKISGNGGNDWLYGGGGNDTLSGGSGNDWISAGAGRDQIFPGDGDDTIVFDGSAAVQGQKNFILYSEGLDTVFLSGDHWVVDYGNIGLEVTWREGYDMSNNTYVLSQFNVVISEYYGEWLGA